MLGYGYSLWLVPYNWKEIQKEFNIDFILHITISTNLPYIPLGVINSGKRFIVKNFKKGEIFPKMYEVDPLNGFGYPCEIEGLYPLHTPHMTLFYASNKITDLDTYSWIKTPPPKQLECTLHLADTTSHNPLQWKTL